jgi:hypothetical protein
VHIFVLCPATLVSGGPEALHQLAHHAAALGHDAQVFYVPDIDGPTQAAYRGYGTRRSTQLIDAPDSVIVVPEIYPHLLPQFDHARRMLWWLSVDNAHKSESDRLAANPGLFTLERSFAPEFGITHLAQSEYARSFLTQRGVVAPMLTDYLSPEFLRQARELRATPKRDIVAYNPKKGLDFTQRLMAASAGRLDWVPIENMTPPEVAALLAGAKVYVDFGEHPGRDRIPREAAMAGCVVITGVRGSAGNGIDIPIPGEYVIGEDTPNAVDRIVTTIEGAMAGFADAHAAFARYRAWINAQEDVFAAEVEALFPRPTLESLGASRWERREAMRAQPIRQNVHVRRQPATATKSVRRKKSAHR